jgi:hypothetical protein
MAKSSGSARDGGRSVFALLVRTNLLSVPGQGRSYPLGLFVNKGDDGMVFARGQIAL